MYKEVATPLIILTITILLALMADRVMQRLIRKATTDLKSDPTNYRFFRHVIVVLIYTTGIALAIFSVPELRTIAKSLLAGAGILAIAVGFASQQALGNVIGGLFIVLFKPFRINDRLVIRDFQGIVEDITLRHTVIKDFENKRIVIPNSLISEEILVNADFADRGICKWIDVNITYDSDLDLAKEIMEREALKHNLQIDTRSPEQLAEGEKEVPVRVLSLGESAVNLRAWVWASDAANGFVLSCDLYESIKKEFDKNGIVIAFPQRSVHIVSKSPKGTVS